MRESRNFPDGLMVEDLPSNTEDVDSLPGQETKILHAMGQLTPHATTKN